MVIITSARDGWYGSAPGGRLCPSLAVPVQLGYFRTAAKGFFPIIMKVFEKGVLHTFDYL